MKKGDIEPARPGSHLYCFPNPHQNNPKNKEKLVFLTERDLQMHWPSTAVEKTLHTDLLLIAR